MCTAIKLLEEMLELDADKRMTAEKALAHPYLTQYADPSDEPNSPAYDQSFEDMELNVEKWKGKFTSNIPHYSIFEFFTTINNSILCLFTIF